MTFHTRWLFAALVAGLLAWAGPSKAENFAPPGCEFDVTFPSGGKFTERDLTVPAATGTGAPAATGRSAEMVYPGFFLRAQCLRYNTCSLAGMDEPRMLETLRALVRQSMPTMKRPVYWVEPVDAQLWGRAQGRYTAGGHDYLVRIGVIYGPCSRIALTFGSILPEEQGVTEWLTFARSVRAVDGEAVPTNGATLTTP